MALGKETQEMLAIKLPYLAPVAEKLDRALGVVKSQNKGWARICFDAQGIDVKGNLIVKRIKATLDFLTKDDD